MSRIHKYRNDIDGLRAFAVISVILYHFGFVSNGYLGVDVFFVISGYLITQILYKESINEEFSLKNFYLRRIRRILPLVFVVGAISLIIAVLVMLPDDLENFSQSLIATNFFSNNILQLITTANYWDTVNEYKPLLHTWSLGIEEQFYIFHPILFLFLPGRKSKFILPILIVLCIVSIFLSFQFANEASKFYLLQYRYYELAVGGIGAILFSNKYINGSIKIFAFIILIIILFFPLPLSNLLKTLLVTLMSLGLVLPGKLTNFLKSILENHIVVYIGKISFSLYMWHQVVLAFSRYFVFEEIVLKQTILLMITIIILSILSYNFIEQPFRSKTKLSTPFLLKFLTVFFVVLTSCAFYINASKGVIKNYPELGLYSNINYKGRLHGAYNDRVYNYDKPFTSGNKIKILVIGNSFARDWVNVLLESDFADRIDVSFHSEYKNFDKDDFRVRDSKYIFLATEKKEVAEYLSGKYQVAVSKIFCTGTKSFGNNNGIFYNRRGQENYSIQRAHINLMYIELNDTLKKQWGDHYIDLISPIMDSQYTVPIFTNECKFISQDTRHLTQFGTKYYAHILKDRIQHIIFGPISI